MTIKHHPTDTTLAAFAAGTLDEARSLVVAAHVSLCPHCRKAMKAFEHVGGALLERAQPVAMHPDAFKRAMARVEEISKVAPLPAPQPGLPAPLAPYELGPWRWIGRGVQMRPVNLQSDDGVRVFMLKAQPGIQLPHHRHAGSEWTCVLEGAFRHDLGRYGPGDFDEADETVEHKPFVEEGVACVCLVALQGNIELQSWLGRLVQPLLRV